MKYLAALLMLLAITAGPVVAQQMGYGSYSTARVRYYTYPSYSYVPSYSLSYHDRVPDELALIRFQIRDLTERMLALKTREVAPAGGLPGAGPGANVPPGVNGGNVKAQAITILSQRCGSCHTGGASKKGFQIFTAPNTFNESVNRMKLYDKVHDGLMPLKGDGTPEPLSDKENDVIRKGLAQ